MYCIHVPGGKTSTSIRRCYPSGLSFVFPIGTPVTLEPPLEALRLDNSTMQGLRPSVCSARNKLVRIAPSYVHLGPYWPSAPRSMISLQGGWSPIRYAL